MKHIDEKTNIYFWVRKWLKKSTIEKLTSLLPIGHPRLSMVTLYKSNHTFIVWLIVYLRYFVKYNNQSIFKWRIQKMNNSGDESKKYYSAGHRLSSYRVSIIRITTSPPTRTSLINTTNVGSRYAVPGSRWYCCLEIYIVISSVHDNNKIVKIA